VHCDSRLLYDMQILLLTYLLTYLFTWFLGLIRVHIQTVPQSVQPFLCGSRMCPIDTHTCTHARTHAHTHRQTDHGTSVTVGHILMLCTGCDVIIMNASVLCKIDKKSLRCANNGILFTQNNHYAVILMYVQISIVFKCFLAKSLRFKLNRYYWNRSHSM